MDFLSASTLPWLKPLQDRMHEALRAARMPHSLLLLSAPGLGAELFANWTAALALCQATGHRPCGNCASCTLLRADTHPDIHRVCLEEDSKQIKVEQVRELIAALTLKSYRGGFKVGVIEGAEALNSNGANAFLKTLEEPGSDTLLMLIASRAHRLPATIASRCVRMVVRAPSAQNAIAWLGEHGGGGSGGVTSDTDWLAHLELAGGAPLLALELQRLDLGSFDADMRESMRAMGSGSIDVTLVAEKWAKSNPGLRLVWLENWITRRIHMSLAGAASTQSAERVRLPAALLKPKIRSLFELLDAARDLRRLASTTMNQQLALEALLLGGRSALAN